MRNYQYCNNKSCLKAKTLYKVEKAMIRIYMRSNQGKEFRDRIYCLSGQPPKIRKQIYLPIGWLCPICKKLHYDKGFWKEEFEAAS